MSLQSFVYSVNRIGDRAVPCGKLAVIEREQDGAA